MYEQYAKIKKEIELLQVIEVDLKARIIADMKERGSIKEKYNFGSFTMSSRKNYTYSPNVTKLVEQVELAKVEEKEKGIATVEITNYITFKE